MTKPIRRRIRPQTRRGLTKKQISQTVFLHADIRLWAARPFWIDMIQNRAQEQL